MPLPRDQTAYWDAVADEKTFSHPLDPGWLADAAGPGARVLDCGCGYGRTTAELVAAGRRAVGVDPSAGMLARARRTAPSLQLVRAAPGTLPFRDGAFDAATLFAVLTCTPDDDAQTALVTELRRVVAPGGVLYVSDLLLDASPRSVARYQAARATGLPHGVFPLDDGAVMRHHDPAWLDRLFGAWTTIRRREFTAVTMNGHTSRATQLLLRR